MGTKAKKEQSKNGGSDRKIFVGAVVWSCAETKLLLFSLFLLCSLATFFQLLPFSHFSAVKLHSCLSAITTINNITSLEPVTTTTTASNYDSDDTHYYPIRLEEEKVSEYITRRAFNPVGAAAYLFIQMGSYRGGPNTFAVIGLASKPLHVYSKPEFHCHWIPYSDSNPNNSNLTVAGQKILPDWGYGRIYTVVVINCTFPSPVGTNNAGGRLLISTTSSIGDGNRIETIEALIEEPGKVDFGIFTSPPKYDYLYCGSSLYGNLSPQRVREWLAYHVRLLGPRSHFVIHDAGGIHNGVMDVLRPWMEKGVVTLEDVRDQERFDGYYHNQFLVVNDCLHRYRFDAKWIFFFDLDEFIYVPPKTSVGKVLDELSNFTQFTIEQMPMSSNLCLNRDLGRTTRMWGIEKLVYRDVKRGIRRDRKYAIQPRNAFATGVHMSQNIVGKSLHRTERRIKYFHYHGTIAERGDPCKEFVDGANLTYEGRPYLLDTTMRLLASDVKKFELNAIGTTLKRTRE